MAGDLGERHAVVEGYYAAQSVTALAQKLGVHMPICRCVHAILFEGKTLHRADRADAAG